MEEAVKISWYSLYERDSVSQVGQRELSTRWETESDGKILSTGIDHASLNDQSVINFSSH